MGHRPTLAHAWRPQAPLQARLCCWCGRRRGPLSTATRRRAIRWRCCWRRHAEWTCASVRSGWVGGWAGGRKEPKQRSGQNGGNQAGVACAGPTDPPTVSRRHCSAAGAGHVGARVGASIFGHRLCPACARALIVPSLCRASFGTHDSFFFVSSQLRAPYLARPTPEIF